MARLGVNKMVKVSVEEVMQLQNRLNEINLIPFCDIDWTENGDSLVIDEAVKDDFRFTGLGNTNFITTGYYQEKHSA
jgi:hypothetical protein